MLMVSGILRSFEDTATSVHEHGGGRTWLLLLHRDAHDFPAMSGLQA